MVDRPDPEEQEQHLCLDKGYDNPTGRTAVENHNYVPHIRRIGEEKTARKNKKHKPRRWVVERTMGWLSKCRAILVRYVKNWFNYLGLIQLACALPWFRRAHRLAATSALLRLFLIQTSARRLNAADDALLRYCR